MEEKGRYGRVFLDKLQIPSGHYAIKGVGCILVGIIAIVFPAFFGVAIEELVAWVFMLAGLFEIYGGLVTGDPSPVSRYCAPILGVLCFGGGLWMAFKPLDGLTTITYCLCGFFLLFGTLRMIIACQKCDVRTSFGFVVSGLISLLMGFLILGLTPTYGRNLLSIVLGADIIIYGMAYLIGASRPDFLEPVEERTSHLAPDFLEPVEGRTSHS